MLPRIRSKRGAVLWRSLQNSTKEDQSSRRYQNLRAMKNPQFPAGDLDTLVQ